MSLLHPFKIDGYVLYLDQLVYIAIDEQETTFYKAVFSDGDKISIPRNLRSELLANLPPSFIYYSIQEMWVNDFYINYMEMRTQPDGKVTLYTRFRRMRANVATQYAGMNRTLPLTRGNIMVNTDHIEEAGTKDSMRLLRDTRLQVSIDALYTMPSEISQEMETIIPPILEKNTTTIVEREIQTQVAPIIQTQVEKAVQNQMDVTDMGVLFNQMVGADDDD